MSAQPQNSAFLQSFFSTPSAFHSIVMSNPDKIPQSARSHGPDDTSSEDSKPFRAESIKLSKPSVASSPIQSPTFSRPKTASRRSSGSSTPSQPVDTADSELNSNQEFVFTSFCIVFIESLQTYLAARRHYRSRRLWNSLSLSGSKNRKINC